MRSLALGHIVDYNLPCRKCRFYTHSKIPNFLCVLSSEKACRQEHPSSGVPLPQQTCPDCVGWPTSAAREALCSEAQAQVSCPPGRAAPEV